MTETAIRDMALERRLLLAEAGDPDACYDLGMACSTGSGGVAIDLIAAHCWFNLAALAGHAAAADCRTEVAFDMTAREVVAAQRQARHILQSRHRMAA
ncbi:MAG: hypothetical protein PGN09_00765 [Sphingomonas fennica]